MKCVACNEDALIGDNMCLMHKQGIEHDVFDSEEPWVCPDCRGHLIYDINAVPDRASVLVCERCQEAWDRKLLIRLSERDKDRVRI